MIYCFEDFELDTDQQELRKAGAAKKIGPQVYSLLSLLLEHHARLVTKDEINQTVWGGRIVSESVLNSRISTAREAIGDDGKRQRLIKTVHGKGFRFVGEVGINPTASGLVVNSAPLDDAPTPTAIPKRSIAVLPFDNMSGDPEQNFLADGLCEDIITVLAKIHGLFVPARNSSFRYRGQDVDVKQAGTELGVRYLLEGSVRCSGDKVRITAQLIETATGAHIWAERYDRKLTDLFALQDEMTRKIVSALQISLTAGEAARVFAAQTDSFEAWEKLIRARNLISTNERSHLLEGKTLLEEAIAIDRDYAHAHYLLGLLYGIAVYNGWSLDVPQAMANARACADRAYAIGPEDAYVLSLLGQISLLEREYDTAKEMSDRAISLAPANPFVVLVSALIAIYTGDFGAAVSSLERVMRLNPNYPINFPTALSAAYYYLGNYDRAKERALESLSMDPYSGVGHVCLAAVQVELGHLNAAQETIRRALEFDPTLCLRRLPVTWLFEESATNERIRETLITAGLPE